MKKFIIGFFVGAVSLIPGISGGTILFITKEFENFTCSLISKKDKKTIKYLLVFISGIISGALICAKIIELLFKIIPYDLLFIFSILLLVSIFSLYNEEKNNVKFKWLLTGSIIILLLATLTPETPYTYEFLPKITILFLLFFSFCGMLDGFITILPGISGSMVMMILGPYYLYKSFLAKINLIYVLPLSLYLIGDLLGIYLGSLFANKMLSKHRNEFISTILGMMFTSTIILFPIYHLDKLHYNIIFITILLIITKKMLIGKN